MSLSCHFRVAFVSLVLSLYFPLSRNREYVVFSIYIEIKHPLVNDDIVIQRLDFYYMVAVEQGYVEALERLSAPMIHLPFLGVVILLHLADYRLCTVDAHAYPHILLVWQIARDGGEVNFASPMLLLTNLYLRMAPFGSFTALLLLTQQRFQLDLLRSSIFGCRCLEGIRPVACILGGDVLGECHQRLEILISVEGILHQESDILGR